MFSEKYQPSTEPVAKRDLMGLRWQPVGLAISCRMPPVSPIRTKHSQSSGKSKAVGHGGIRTHIQRERGPLQPTVRRSMLTWPGVCEFNTAFMNAVNYS